MKKSLFLILASLSLTLYSCSGGGSDGSSGGSSDASGIRLVHGALSTSPAIFEQFKGESDLVYLGKPAFNQATGFKDIGTGTKTYQIYPTLSPNKLIRENIDIQKSARSTIFLFGSEEIGTLQALKLEDTRKILTPGEIGFRIVNGVARNVAVELRLNDGAPVRVEYGAASIYQYLTTQSFKIFVKDLSTRDVYVSRTVTLNPNLHYSLFLTGEKDIFVTDLIVED